MPDLERLSPGGDQVKRRNLPCLLHIDEDVVCVCKPSGLLTHRASPEGVHGMAERLEEIYGQKPGVHQRLDRATSGVMIFSLSRLASQDLQMQFETRRIQKKYYLVTRSLSNRKEWVAENPIEGKPARTCFRWMKELPSGQLWEAIPETGRTHQIRHHASACGIPIVGDSLQNAAESPLLLHAGSLGFRHPRDGRVRVVEAPLPGYFYESSDELRKMMASVQLRNSLISLDWTTTYRLVHPDVEGFSGLAVDRLGSWILVEEFSEGAFERSENVLAEITRSKRWGFACKGMLLGRAVKGTRRPPRILLSGEMPSEEIRVLEDGLSFVLKPLEPGNPGLFTDQRNNRWRIRRQFHGKKILNLFSFTCGFSIAGAVGGASTCSVDLSRKYLEWGKANFQANGLAVDKHAFWAGDVRSVVRRMLKRNERFDCVVVDPPSFSRSREGGSFAVKKDLATLVTDLIPLVNPSGQMLISCNLADWPHSDFRKKMEAGAKASKRPLLHWEWVPQSEDFPSVKGLMPHLKAAWMTLG